MSVAEPVTVGVACLVLSLLYCVRVDIAYLVFYCVAVLLTNSDASKEANHTILERPKGCRWPLGDRG